MNDLNLSQHISSFYENIDVKSTEFQELFKLTCAQAVALDKLINKANSSRSKINPSKENISKFVPLEEYVSESKLCKALMIDGKRLRGFFVWRPSLFEGTFKTVDPKKGKLRKFYFVKPKELENVLLNYRYKSGLEQALLENYKKNLMQEK